MPYYYSIHYLTLEFLCNSSELTEQIMLFRRIIIISPPHLSVHLVQQRTPPNTPQEWLNKLPQMTKYLEAALYFSAASFHEYQDTSTLKQRLQQLAVIKGIGESAFLRCNQLANVELREGLRRIDKRVFQNCSTPTSIAIPSTVEVIGTKAFLHCTQLASVELREGLERIDERAFEGCTSLESIRIPSTVKFIHSQAFFDCNNLAAIEFWDEIEQLVNEASLPWWNRGVSEAALRTYYFLAQCNIRSRLDQIKFQTWKNNIHAMLQRIPEELEDKNYLQSIASQLANYEHLQEVAPLLELALWKSKISEQTNTKDIDAQLKLQCRFNSLSMAPIIIQNALSFL